MKTKICRECGCIGQPSKGLINNHNIQTSDLSKEFENKFVDCLKCPNCGHSWIPEKSTREQAIEWWNNQPKVRRQELYFGYFGCNIKNGQWEDEIEEIWKAETNQKDKLIISSNTIKPQVDFEMLNFTHNHIMVDLTLTKEVKDNLSLFFEMLSKSSSFAHKAHKELNRLNK